MPEVRKDIIRDNWVVIATERSVKPNDLPVPATATSSKKDINFCPFCEGNEAFTPPELAAYRDSDSNENGPGWQIRAIPNKFAAFRLQDKLTQQPEGLYTKLSSYGTHEVIIESPSHDVQFHEQTTEKLQHIYAMLRQRYCALAANPDLKHIQIYKNAGLFAGASLTHSHTQIIALPYVPEQSRGTVNYYKEHNRCVYCDMIEQEKTAGARIVTETEHFIVLCPYASRFTYETWIIPKKHNPVFGDISDDEINDLATLSKRVLQALIATLDNPSYNLVINTGPVNVENNQGYHWLLEIWPRLIVQAGIEIATGFFMNPISPEWATESLRAYLSEQE